MNSTLNERGLMNIAGKKRELTGCSRGTLHKAKRITLIESTKIRWFSRQLGGGGWSLLLEAKSIKTTQRGLSGSNPLRLDGSRDGSA